MSLKIRLALVLLAALALSAAAVAPRAAAGDSEKVKIEKKIGHVELGPETLAYLAAATTVSCTASCSDGAATPLTCSASGSGASCTQSKDGRTATCEDDDGLMVCDCTTTPRRCTFGV